MASVNPTRTVKVLTGPFAGRLGFVTWDDGSFIRVTPLDGDPLLSLELTHDQVEEAKPEMIIFDITDIHGNEFGPWAAETETKALDEIYQDIQNNPDWYIADVSREDLRAEVLC